ncbi:MAG: twin-arginine translocase subunit TatB [Betaproteobacteria bacterium]|nr:twin-arginine translocase subunit TatB [Betaproteobacteria bacterium]
MFDISFWELGIVGVVALIVIGPERLPGVARTAGHMFGRFQRYVASVRSDIQREIDASELAKVKQEVNDAARVFETSVQEHASSFQSDVQAMDRSLAAPPAESSTATAPTTATPASALLNDATAATEPPAPLAAKTTPTVPPERAATHDTTFSQGQFDFGVEPVRAPAKRGTP